MASIDRADWHYGAENFPADLPEENGATHIGFFVRWAIGRGLLADDEAPAEAIEAVRAGKLSGRDFLLEHLDGKLWSSMLTEEGQAFAEAHYSDDYLEQVHRVLSKGLESSYHADDSDKNYRKMAVVLDRYWARFKRRKTRRKK
jgi:hypothetical protein